MKKLGLLALSFLVLTSNTFADCRDIAKNKKIRLFDSTRNEQFYMAGGSYVGALFIPAVASASFIAAIPFAVAVPGIYVLIKNTSKNRYIKLVNQAEDYVATNGEEKAGRLLRKFKKRLENHTNLNLLEVATFIKDGNQSDLFCPNERFINIQGIKTYFDQQEVDTISI